MPPTVIVYLPGVGTDTGNVNGMSIRGNNLVDASRHFVDDGDVAVVVALPYNPCNNLLTVGMSSDASSEGTCINQFGSMSLILRPVANDPPGRRLRGRRAVGDWPS